MKGGTFIMLGLVLFTAPARASADWTPDSLRRMETHALQIGIGGSGDETIRLEKSRGTDGARYVVVFLVGENERRSTEVPENIYYALVDRFYQRYRTAAASARAVPYCLAPVTVGVSSGGNAGAPDTLCLDQAGDSAMLGLTEWVTAVESLR